MTDYSSDSDALAKKLVATVGKKIVIGTPIGIGKPIQFLNAIYRLAKNDSSLQLTIITGLTLTRPRFKSFLEEKFLKPIVERLIGDYEDPLYEQDRLKQTVPDNIKIIEFFLNPAKYLNNPYVQQNYISSSYTDIMRDSFIQSMNVIAQLVTYDAASKRYSTSCSADLFYDAIAGLKAQAKPFAVIGEVNQHLPFMHGEALAKANAFTHVLDTKVYPHLYALPREALSWQDHMIGLYTSTLIKDNGCLQMGIGKLSNAVTESLLLRNRDNASYQAMLKELNITATFNDVVNQVGESGVFVKGLYASTEMLCDGYVYLHQDKIIKKKVYDHIGLQRLLNKGCITETIELNHLAVFIMHGLIKADVTVADMQFLHQFGILDHALKLENHDFITPEGDRFPADLNSEVSLQKLQTYLGDKLKDGKVIHAGFFVGSNAFYKGLHQLTEAEREAIDMVTIQRTNGLLWSPELASLQRIHARFVNTCMMVTLGGELISDCLQNFQEISGVGGQYDFVCMAAKLQGARSIITCRSTRTVAGKVESNIVWEYSKITIPRYLRDIVVTEYGIADCRGKTDAETMQAILQITDSRFQPELLAKAKAMNKLPKAYVLPEHYRQNYPAKQQAFLATWQAKGFFPAFPFGCDLTEEELVLEKALGQLRRMTKLTLVKTLLKACLIRDAACYHKYLNRMGLQKPDNLTMWVYKKLLMYILTPFVKTELSAQQIHQT